jgi:hypothetical protein
MAVVSGITIDQWQMAELAKYISPTDELNLRFSLWPDGHITVDDGDTVIIEFEPSGL